LVTSTNPSERLPVFKADTMRYAIDAIFSGYLRYLPSLVVWAPRKQASAISRNLCHAIPCSPLCLAMPRQDTPVFRSSVNMRNHPHHLDNWLELRQQFNTLFFCNRKNIFAPGSTLPFPGTVRHCSEYCPETLDYAFQGRIIVIDALT